jgi:hypothetical protein
MKIIELAAVVAVAAGALAAGASGAGAAATAGATVAVGPAARTADPAAQAAAGAKHGGWGNAREVPGTAALNTAGSAGVQQVSCGSAGNCVAAGVYLVAPEHPRPFVSEQKTGIWGKAHAIPGIAALSGGRGAAADFVSCRSAGNCTVAGSYTDASGNLQWFTADETNGAWQHALAIPGLAKLATAFGTTVKSLSCASGRNCAVAGLYHDQATNNPHAFVADESGGTWGQAHVIPGEDTLGPTEATAVSCASAGNCGVTGNYTDTAGNQQVFVADETSGTWGQAQALPGLEALNASGHAEAAAISCRAPGNCATGGTFSGVSDVGAITESYVADERQGGWDLAVQVFGGRTPFNGSNLTTLGSVSCASVGNCAAAGSFADPFHGFSVYVVNEVDGSWGNAIRLPGIVALDKGLKSDVFSISCPSPGNCAAGGAYTDANGHVQAFVANQSATAGAS